MTKQHFNWYGLVAKDADLDQGDLLGAVPVPLPPTQLSQLFKKSEEPIRDVPVELFNVIVMTQTCDLADMKPDDPVMMCPHFSYAELTKTFPTKYGATQWKDLVDGRIVSKHLLNKCDLYRHSFDYQVVELKMVISIPFKLVKDIASSQRGQRVRLLPPYREQLSQAFARQFMRVGLPLDLPRKYAPPAQESNISEPPPSTT